MGEEWISRSAIVATMQTMERVSSEYPTMRNAVVARSCAKALSELPAASVIPVASAEWWEKEYEEEYNGERYKFRFFACSNCGERKYFRFEKSKFCPNCGCKMNGTEE